MTSYDFNADWTVGPQVSVFNKLMGPSAAQPVTLPHDALISQERSASHRGGGAFFPSAAFEYRKTVEVPAEWRDRAVWLRFDGVYRDAVVFVNDALAGHCANGYVPFDIDVSPFLRYGQENAIRVEARTHDDSRWYAGAGIYRDVVLEVRDLIHIEPGTAHISATDIDDDRAVVDARTTVVNRTNETRTVRARLTVTDRDGVVVASADDPVTVIAGGSIAVRSRGFLESPHRWDIDDPYLYRATVELVDDDVVIGEETTDLGIRTLQLDPRRGLRLNGKTVKLRGTCLHHDNGILGTACFADTEMRKIRLLKEAGFTAVRSAHNMMSTAMLRACDRLGMIVMDEVYDVWTVQKSSFDSSVNFLESWRHDVSAMVRRDRNHASVVFYSIGNEIPETGNAHGGRISREMADLIRELDPARYVTNGINGFVSVLDDVIALMASGAFGGGAEQKESGGVNDVMSSSADGMNQLNRSELVTAKTEESFAALDVAGLNYGDARYAMDAERFPNRVIVGSETYPGRIGSNWPLVQELPHVIGDFTWTGWDYLGEVGIGRPRWEGEDLRLEAAYPWLTAWCGDIDITGRRRPASYFREIVFGLRTDPYITVRNPLTRERTQLTGTWSWADAESTWSWDVEDGAAMTVEVYAPGDEVELWIGDRSLGRRPSGRAVDFTASFEVPFGAEDLTAVSYAEGVETGRSTLRAVRGEAAVRIRPEQTSTALAPGALLFVPIEIQDDAGTVVTHVDRTIEVSVSGAAELLAFGSARPDNGEGFSSDAHRSFGGRVLAVLRPTGVGSITVEARAAGLGIDSIELEVTA
ncbi:glycoside hydrolase family 2 TIM barrel-domain containing protein [Microbacterium sp. NPDC089320]|uniref:glycoside hydrolase family 2 TIM barrel-domain containing protein n=1 Tax=Microbacterium sp. NPDC089320 TaxID=3155182 RepID=UPI00342EE691